MSRTQKKCFIASTGVHLLLVLILVIGPGFLSSRNAPVDLPILDFVPLKTVDALVSGGGSPTAKPPPAPEDQPPTPTPPAPPAPPKPPPEPDPPQKEVAKDPTPVKSEPESLVPTDKPKPRKPEVSTKLVTRAPDADAEAKAKA